MDLAKAVEGMHSSRPNARVLLIIDTCQAATLFPHIRVPNLLAVASSGAGGPWRWQLAAWHAVLAGRLAVSRDGQRIAST